jgi:hypothetical protein
LAALLIEIRDDAASGLADPQTQEFKHHDECEVAAVGRLVRCGQQGLELQVGQT